LHHNTLHIQDQVSILQAESDVLLVKHFDDLAVYLCAKINIQNVVKEICLKVGMKWLISKCVM